MVGRLFIINEESTVNYCVSNIGLIKFLWR